MTSSPRLLLVLGLLAASTVACGRSDLEAWVVPVKIVDASVPDVRDATPPMDARRPACVPGQQIACTCPGDAGALGVTVCEADGGMTACMGCPNLDATPPHDTGIDAACSPGSRDCVGETPEICGANGQWKLQAPCSGDTPLCADGQCIACSPGTVQCVGMTPQICTASGGWQDQPACAQPTPDCSLGACTCLETMCGASCIDLKTDPNNCGACGHSCLGGGCMDAACEPVVVTTLGNVPLQIATDSTFIYWTDDAGDVLKIKIAGGTTTTLAVAPASPPTGLGVTATTAYWSSASEVLSVKVTGGTSTVISAADLGGLAIDSANVYWGGRTLSGFGTVLSAPLAGGATSTVATIGQEETPTTLATDGTNVYFEVARSTGAAILSVPRGGGSATTIATLAESTSAIAAGGGLVYWTQEDTGFALPLNSTVVALGVSGDAGSPTPAIIANAQSDVGPIVTDGTSVFWANNCGVPFKPCGSMLALDPTSPEIRVLAPAQSTVNGVATDTNRVFWTSYDSEHGVGSIIWVAK